MRAVNVLIALSSTAKDTVRPLLNDDDYKGTHLKAVRILRKMANIGTVEKVWRSPRIAGKDWHLFEASFVVTDKDKVRDALDFLNTEYPNNAAIVGAWWYDGRQVGTRFTYDEDGQITGTTGTPLYPIHPRLIDFMPDEEVRDGNGDLLFTQRPTQLSQVHLRQGQAPRRFD